MDESPPPPSPETAQPYLAPAVPGSIPLFYLLLLLLPLLLGGGLRKVLGLAELLGGLRHGAAAVAAAAARVTAAPALLSLPLPPAPSPFPLFPLSPPEPCHSPPRLRWQPRHVCARGEQRERQISVRMMPPSSPPAATQREDATACGADAARLCRGCYSSTLLALR